LNPQVTKTKGNFITAVGWCISNNSQTTGPILLGTSKGFIYETEINQSGTEVYWKQVRSIKKFGTKIADKINLLGRRSLISEEEQVQ